MAGKSKCVSYKRTTTTALKTAGFLNIEDDEIYIGTEDGDVKALSSLLSAFQGAPVELSVSIKDVEDLPDPTQSED